MTSIEFSRQLMSLEPKLSGFAMTLTANRDEAKDLLQDTFLKAITNREKFVNFSGLKAWTCTIMKNTFINNYRRTARQSTTLDSTKNLHFLNLSRKVYDLAPDSYYEAGEINRLIDSLEDEFKIPFKLLLEGFKYKEISEKLQLNIGTVKNRIFFSRKKLMALLDEF